MIPASTEADEAARIGNLPPGGFYIAERMLFGSGLLQIMQS
jgi:hypothetical protein